MKKRVMLYCVFLIIILSTCSCSNSSNIGVSKNDKEQQFLIHIENHIGIVEIKDNNALAISLFKEIGDTEGTPVISSNKDLKNTALGCPMDNEVTIFENGKEISKFWVAGDGCKSTIKRDGTVNSISDDIYKKINLIMNTNDNTLADEAKNVYTLKRAKKK